MPANYNYVSDPTVDSIEFGNVSQEMYPLSLYQTFRSQQYLFAIKVTYMYVYEEKQNVTKCDEYTQY